MRCSLMASSLSSAATMVTHNRALRLLGVWAVIATLTSAQGNVTVAPTPATSATYFQTGSPGPSKLPYENGSGLWIEYEEFDLLFQTRRSEDDNDDYYVTDDDYDAQEHIPTMDKAQDIVDSLEGLMREQSLQQLGDNGVDFWFPHVDMTVIEVLQTRPPPTGNPPKKAKLAFKFVVVPGVECLSTTTYRCDNANREYMHKLLNRTTSLEWVETIPSYVSGLNGDKDSPLYDLGGVVVNA